MLDVAVRVMQAGPTRVAPPPLIKNITSTSPIIHKRRKRSPNVTVLLPSAKAPLKSRNNTKQSNQLIDMLSNFNSNALDNPETALKYLRKNGDMILSFLSDSEQMVHTYIIVI